MKKNLKIKILVASITLLMTIAFLPSLAYTKPIEPITYDYAEFRADPYPIGTYQMTIYYHHDSHCSMTIWLLNPADNEANYWTLGAYNHEGYIYYSPYDYDGQWRLQCYMPGYQPYITDAAILHTFGISDPQPEQNNLGSDWARHPDNINIYEKAFSLIGQSTSSYDAAYKIYQHVLTYFVHDDTGDISFKNDLTLLNELDTQQHYYGVCRSDAVILTSYARALGIPARIICLYAHLISSGLQPPGGPDQYHYFAEFYVNYCGQYEWIPVDGDPIYNWFGINQANQRISQEWPYSRQYSWNPPRYECWRIYISIVTNIPSQGIIDDGYTTASYPNHPYRNNL